MSRAFEEAEDFYNSGLNAGTERNVCSLHFNETAVKSLVRTVGTKGVCDYCSKSRNVIPLAELMKFLMDTVSYFYTDPVNFANFDSSEDGYQVPHTDAWEILEEQFGIEIDDYQLSEDMKSWIDFGVTWADEKVMHSEGHYRRPDAWSNFCYLVKHHARYLFQYYRDEWDIHAQNPMQILKEAEKVISQYKLVKIIPADLKVFRCRQHSKSEVISIASQMCAPGNEFCKNPNRMSPAGISMFYCAFDVPTCLSETLEIGWKETSYTTVSFTTLEDINIIDLSNLPSVPSYFDREKRKRFEDLVFLRDFVTDLTKPIERDERVHVDYVPTQIVTEFFRFLEKKKIDGIIYPSSRNHGHQAMVLFYDHYESLSKLKFNSGTLNTKGISSYPGKI